MPHSMPGPIPCPPTPCPYWHIDNFLGAAVAAELLAYAVANEPAFEASRVGSSGGARCDLKRRRSSVYRLDDALGQQVRLQVSERIPAAIEALGMYPFAFDELEIELAAHGDGAFFSRHTDVRRDVLGSVSSRAISAVYYFHEMPCRFEGGMLRLYGLGRSGESGHVDISPRHDSLVFFPSSEWHEVLPVHAPGIGFAQQRFALNIWIHKTACGATQAHAGSI